MAGEETGKGLFVQERRENIKRAQLGQLDYSENNMGEFLYPQPRHNFREVVRDQYPMHCP